MKDKWRPWDKQEDGQMEETKKPPQKYEPHRPHRKPDQGSQSQPEENAGQTAPVTPTTPAVTLPGMTQMAPYQGQDYVQSDAVTQAQQLLQNLQANQPGAYQSQFQNGMNDLMNQLMNRGQFQYDVNADALYQQVAQNYLRQGQMAMMDTIGQAAALTGGYGNSYAQNAGQQAYQGYLQDMTNLIPQYYQMALDRYQMEGDQLMDKYALLAQQEESAYSRYQDDLNRYYADLDRAQAAYDNERDYDYSRFADDRDFDYGKYMDDLNYQYQLDRDKIADEQWIQQLLYQQERDKIADEQWQKEYEESVRQFNENLAFQQSQAAKSGSSGGGGGGSGSGSSAPSSTPATATPIFDGGGTVNNAALKAENLLEKQAASKYNSSNNTGNTTSNVSSTYYDMLNRILSKK